LHHVQVIEEYIWVKFIRTKNKQIYELHGFNKCIIA
jgi:hypothetical protein